MALSKKKSRKITVDGMPFRYVCSTSKSNVEDFYKLNVTCQHVESNGAYLVVEGLVTRDFWLDLSDSPSSNPLDYPVLLPRHLAILISTGMTEGWKYLEHGAPHKLEINNHSLFQ